MTVDTRLPTADELLRMPDDGFRYELVRGELRKMSPAGGDHGDIAMTIGAHLKSFAKASSLGKVYAAETGFLLSRNPDTVRAPDVAFVRTERVVKTSGYIPGAPDLVIEVVSPSDTYSEVRAKTREWLNAGTRAVVIVDGAKRLVEVHRMNEMVIVDDVLAVEDVVPGWRLAVAEIFE
jgi:Uma2 family endonuclease